MKKNVLFLGLFSLLIVFGISCNRPEPALTPATPEVATDAPYQGSISIEEAQNYFTNTVLKTTRTARKADEKQYERIVDWSTASKVKQANGLEVIVSSINYKNDSRPGVIIWDDKTAEDQKKPKIENVLKAREVLLTFKDKTGQLQTQLVQYLPSKEFREKKSASTDGKDFSGWVLAQTWGEKVITGFEYKDGKDIRKLIASEKAAGARPAECYYTYIGGVSVVCYPCGSNCTQCDATVSGSYSGYCTNPSSDSGTGSSGVNYGGSGGTGGSGGGGFGYYTGPVTDISGYATFNAPPGLKPMVVRSDRCDFSQEAWNRSVASGKEYVGFVTKNGEYILTQQQNTSGGTVNGTITQSTQDGVKVFYYYPFEEGTAQLSGSIVARIQGAMYWAVEIRSTMHTHTPCMTDGTDGVSHPVGEDDQNLANALPTLNHFVIGCNATAQYNGSNPNFYNKGGGCIILFSKPSSKEF